MKVNVKWNKELLQDIDVDISQPPSVFKIQLFSLTGVPPERQKIMIPKAGLLKDDDWGKAQLKDGQTLMMMGTADKIPEAPAEAPKFLEDLPEDERAAAASNGQGVGLVNLGNTCYMNATLQCLYSVEELRNALARYGQSGLPTSADTSGALAVEAARLFQQMGNSGTPVNPFKFLSLLRAKYPQFAQTGERGTPMQQDAEECWSQLMYTFREKVQDSDNESVIKKLFGVGLTTTLKCAESGEEIQEANEVYMLKCNISKDINHLHEGIELGLVEDREKNSAQLGRLAVFAGSSRINALPPYITVQMVRFFYKVDVQQKAKILRKVTYPVLLDMFDFCTSELKTQLRAPRAAFKALEDRKHGLGASSSTQGKSDGDGDADMKDADADAEAHPEQYSGQITGRYELIAVLTHKGRSADSGHYVGWARQDSDNWVEFDDDTVRMRKTEDIVALSGGGDWHMAYLLLYRAQRVPAVQQEPPAAAAVVAQQSAEPMQS